MADVENGPRDEAQPEKVSDHGGGNKVAIHIICMTQHVRPCDVQSFEAVGWSVVQGPYRDREEGKILIERDFRS